MSITSLILSLYNKNAILSASMRAIHWFSRIEAVLEITPNLETYMNCQTMISWRFTTFIVASLAVFVYNNIQYQGYQLVSQTAKFKMTNTQHCKTDIRLSKSKYRKLPL